MTDRPEILTMAAALARHSAARQGVIAQNVAQADTPGYRAEDLPNFTETYRATSAHAALHTTRAGHIAGGGATAATAAARVDDRATVAPNGNSVSLEAQMVKAAETRQSHEMALSVYKSALGILRTSLSRGR
ncbi:flagellar basal-body rod protein FlgB [Rhodovulum iodosum]|uniref:Flagellar basal body rod protein FlgB n=1 Tax=Rhodovulum iodosum TaxID=68291 RepID=A0ABV3XRE7_9RHOB|nr:FlgB family protein [Rhodovulum robiginosum]RSK40018.1 FlgB family protein [Rhodovulum robiginosum]